MFSTSRSNAEAGFDPRGERALGSGEGALSASALAYQYWTEGQVLSRRDIQLRPRPGIVEAEEILDLKVDLDLSLSAGQKILVKSMEHAILEGDAPQLLALCRTFGHDPEGLRVIAERCRRDLAPALTSISFCQRYLQAGAGQPSQLIAVLTVMEKHGGTAVLFTNNKDLGLGVCGPYALQPDGSYRLDMNAGPDDPQRVLAAIGRKSAEQIVLLNGEN